MKGTSDDPTEKNAEHLGIWGQKPGFETSSASHCLCYLTVIIMNLILSAVKTSITVPTSQGDWLSKVHAIWGNLLYKSIIHYS